MAGGGANTLCARFIHRQPQNQRWEGAGPGAGPEGGSPLAPGVLRDLVSGEGGLRGSHPNLTAEVRDSPAALLAALVQQVPVQHPPALADPAPKSRHPKGSDTPSLLCSIDQCGSVHPG